MKKLKFFVFAFMAICLASCGGKRDSDGTSSSSSDNSVTLKIEETGMGNFNKFGSFQGEVVIRPSDDSEDKDAKEKKYVMSIPLNITTPVAWKYNLDFEITIADENHNVIAELSDLYVDGEYDEDNGDFNDYLLAGSQRQSYEDEISDEIWEKIKAKGKFLVIKCDADSKDIVPYTKGGSLTSSVD